MKSQDIKSLVVASVFFLILFLGLSWNVILCALLSCALYVAMTFLIRPKRKIRGADISDRPDAEALEALFKDAESDLTAIDVYAKASPSSAVQHSGQALYQTGNAILNYLGDHTDRISIARRFFTYYLDTAVDLLTHHQELCDSGIETEELAALQQRLEDALETLNQAFKDQYLKLMQNEIIDMDTEMTVLENIRKMEHLS